MKKECMLKLPDEVVMKAKAANIRLCLPVENKMTIDLQDDCMPDFNGICVGYVDKDTDILKSNIKEDDDASKLRAYIENGLVMTKNLSQMTSDDKKLKKVPHYFMVYDVMDSSKQRETYTESSVDCCTSLSSGYYKCEYEILLGSEEYTRRMVFETKSTNISMCEWLKDLLDELETGIDTKDESIAKHFFKNEFGNTCFTMFDKVGIATEIEFDRYEFESMIVGIRQLSCEYIKK